jgi:Nitrogenase molybdenum-iron protein, alpha and beta chains
MKKLLRLLPPFAPDYSGACSALFELGGMLVINDASGCTGNYTGFDEPRWYGSKSAVFCSGLREIDAILGDDKKLIKKIVAAAEELNPKFIALMGSPVPMVIGTDMDGISRELESLLGIPVFGFNTTGIGYYDKGISQALIKIAENFLKDRPEYHGQIIKSSINILGATPLDLGTTGALTDMKSLFEEAGLKVLSCWAMGSGLDELKLAGLAEKNVVVSWSGLELARFLEKEYGTPYITGIPIGEKGANDIVDLVKATKRENDSNSVPHDNSDSDILIIGEQVSSNSLRNYMRNELGIQKVKAASFFTMEKSLMERGDFFIDCEESLELHFKTHYYKNVVGDPLYKQLIPDENILDFVELPHVAVSSRIHWNECKSLMGSKAAEIIMF